MVLVSANKIVKENYSATTLCLILCKIRSRDELWLMKGWIVVNERMMIDHFFINHNSPHGQIVYKIVHKIVAPKPLDC